MAQNSRDFTTYSINELRESARLLITYKGPKDRTRLLTHPVSVEFNPESKTVFLVDQNFHTAVIRDGALEDCLLCPCCLNEGYRDELFSSKVCCRQYAALGSDKHAA